jgi:hypothetical protein
MSKPACPVCDPKSGVHATIFHWRTNQAALADQIRHNWAETLERIVQTGSWLIEGRFRKADYQQFTLPFSYSWGRKLIRISRSPRILNPVHRAVLPNKADALHQITLLTDRLFVLGVAEGVINNQCLVIDIKQFRKSFIEPRESKTRRMTTVYECRPERDQSATELLDAFAVAVQRLAQARFPAINVRPPRRMRELMQS